MKQVDAQFVKHAFAGPESLKEYRAATREIGLWVSEKMLFTKHIKTTDLIMDMGCGTGRITYGLYALGYTNIKGVDVSEAMIQEALSLNVIGDKIPFEIGDATGLNEATGSYDVVIFGYNGLMQIPWLENRKKAFMEIARILKADGVFIFTTHDIEAEAEGQFFWREERKRWEKGVQNPRLAEFGDLIYPDGDREMFMHVPERAEILTCLEESGFELIEDYFRTQLCEENEAVRVFSDECRFWVGRKR